jgi:hypothetical protein
MGGHLSCPDDAKPALSQPLVSQVKHYFDCRLPVPIDADRTPSPEYQVLWDWGGGSHYPRLLPFATDSVAKATMRHMLVSQLD